MKSETRNAIATVVLALAMMPAWGADSTAKTVVGGAIGGAGGAAIGGALGGKTATPEARQQTAATTGVVQQQVVSVERAEERGCGHKKHAGKGWAKRLGEERLLKHR